MIMQARLIRCLIMELLPNFYGMDALFTDYIVKRFNKVPEVIVLARLATT
jgi:hypothetical protein